MKLSFTFALSILLGYAFSEPGYQTTSVNCDPEHFPDPELELPLEVFDIENAFQITVIPRVDPTDTWSLNLTAPANGKGGLDAELMFPGFEAAYFNLRNGTLYMNSSNQTATVGSSPAKLRFGTSGASTKSRLEVHARLSCRNEKLTYTLEFLKRFKRRGKEGSLPVSAFAPDLEPGGSIYILRPTENLAKDLVDLVFDYEPSSDSKKAGIKEDLK